MAQVTNAHICVNKCACVCVRVTVCVSAVIAAAVVVPKNMINDILHLFSMMIIYTPFATHRTN